MELGRYDIGNGNWKFGFGLNWDEIKIGNWGLLFDLGLD